MLIVDIVTLLILLCYSDLLLDMTLFFMTFKIYFSSIKSDLAIRLPPIIDKMARTSLSMVHHTIIVPHTIVLRWYIIVYWTVRIHLIHYSSRHQISTSTEYIEQDILSKQYHHIYSVHRIRHKSKQIQLNYHVNRIRHTYNIITKTIHHTYHVHRISYVNQTI